MATADRRRCGGRVMVLEDLLELIQAQQLAAWNEAARRIAHEIKNPLTPIRLAAERILQKHRRGDPTWARPSRRASRSCCARSAPCRRWSTSSPASRACPARSRPAVDLGRLVEETAPPLPAAQAGGEVETEVEPGAEELMADPEQLKRALSTCWRTPSRPPRRPATVTVAASARRRPRRARRWRTPGRGIPDEDKDKLFLPYFSTKGRGTGLGLAIVHRIVSDHRGRIRVEDNEPKGTVFTVELPLR